MSVEQLKNSGLATLVVMVLGLLSRWWNARLILSKSLQKSQVDSEHIYREDLRLRVVQLIEELRQANLEKDAALENFAQCREINAELRVRLQVMQERFEPLQQRIVELQQVQLPAPPDEPKKLN